MDGAADVLVAVDGLRGAPRQWGEVVELGERVGRIARGGRGVIGPAAVALRRAARGLLADRRADGGDDGAGMVVLAIAFAELLVEIGHWQQARGRPHQAAAARRAASLLAQHNSGVRRHDRQLALDLAPARDHVPATL